jgi:ABC-type uncharacterized transport system substrate-binding protein
MSLFRVGPVALGLSFGAVLLGVPAVAASHPHVFVDVGVLLVFTSEGLAGMRVSWTFDEMTSSTLHATFDTNRDGRFSPDELRAIERQFRTLKRDRYYLDVQLDGRPVSIDDVTAFEASSTDGRVTYVFSVSLPPRRAGLLDVRVDDPTYFTAFEPVSGSVAQSAAAAAYLVHCRVKNDPRSGEAPSINCAYRVKSK